MIRDDECRASARKFKLGCIVLGTFAIIMGAAIWGSYDLLIYGINTKDVGLVAAISGLAGTVIGSVGAGAQQVIGFYFGSSSGSEKKTEAISRIMDKSNFD